MICKHCGKKLTVWKDGIQEKYYCPDCGYTPGYEKSY